MRQVDHFIVGGAGGTAARKHQIWNPSTGEVQAEVALGDAALLQATPLSENEYKVQLARVAVKRAILRAAGFETGGF
mgnify:CR=1 FL=1